MRLSFLVRIGLSISFVAALGACTASSAAPPAPPAGGDAITQALAEHAADLVDAGPGGPMVLLPGAADPSRQFAAALALTPFADVTPYLGQLSREWSDKDARYGPPGQLSEQAAVTRLAALLATSAADYRAALFPAGRLDALRANAAIPGDQDLSSSLADSIKLLLDGHSIVDCDALAEAVLSHDLAAAARIAGPAQSARCGTPSPGLVDIASAEATGAAKQILGWQVPDPGQVIDLASRLTWVASYAKETMRPALAPMADALAGYLSGYAEASAPFLPNIPADQLRLLFSMMRLARPDWEPDDRYLEHLKRTLYWHGRLPEHVRNDPTTFIFSLRLLSDAPAQDVLSAMPRLRAAVLVPGADDPLDRGLRAIAARRPDLITPAVLTGAAHAVADDPRLGARLAALVENGQHCPPDAARTLNGLLTDASNVAELSATYVYYDALITQASARCTNPTPAREALRTAAGKYLDQVATVLARPDWPGWLELWLRAEATCALGDRPTLDPAALTQAAGGMLTGSAEPVWSTFDPTSAYAMSRVLAIARHGCQGAWYTSAP